MIREWYKKELPHFSREKYICKFRTVKFLFLTTVYRLTKLVCLSMECHDFVRHIMTLMKVTPWLPVGMLCWVCFSNRDFTSFGNYTPSERYDMKCSGQVLEFFFIYLFGLNKIVMKDTKIKQVGNFNMNWKFILRPFKIDCMFCVRFFFLNPTMRECENKTHSMKKLCVLFVKTGRILCVCWCKTYNQF